MTINAVEAASSTGMYAAQSTRAPKQEMDGELFMTLLVTQLQNQDPSAPMDTNAMIGQTTQLAMMEKLNTLAETNTENFSLQMRSSAAALMGREISYTGAYGEPLTGTVSSVSFAGDIPMVTVNGTAVSLDEVSGVTSGTPGTPGLS